MGGRTKIDWCDSTINPVRGCSRGCEYCYARKLNARWGWVEDFSVPQFFPKALEQPYKWKRPRIIFVCSLGELFDPMVPDAWIHRTFAMMGENPQHKFLLLTKRADYACAWLPILPVNARIGVTITSEKDAGNRLCFYVDGQWRSEARNFVSFEPLLGSVEDVDMQEFSWIIIGAQTNPNVQPKRVWVQDILNRAGKFGIPVLMKHNLEWPAGERRFEFPPELEKIRSG